MEKAMGREIDGQAREALAWVRLDGDGGGPWGEAALSRAPSAARVWRWAPLFKAIARRDEAEVARQAPALVNKARGWGMLAPNPRDKQGRTPLMAAASLGWAKGVEALLAACPREDGERRGKSSLMCLLASGRQDEEAALALRLILKDRPGLSSVDDGVGMTPLMRAAEAGWVLAVEELLAHGGASKVRMFGNGSWVDALGLACHGGHGACAASIARELRGEKPSGWGRQALELAAERSLDCVEAVLGAGASPAGSQALAKALAAGRLDCAARLVRAGAQAGEGLLGWAASRGEVDLARALLEKGADPNGADSGGERPLGLAASNGQSGVARLLLEHGASPQRAGAREKAAKGSGVLELIESFEEAKRVEAAAEENRSAPARLAWRRVGSLGVSKREGQ